MTSDMNSSYMLCSYKYKHLLTHISFSFVTLLALVFLSRRTEVVRAHFKAVLGECNARKSDEQLVSTGIVSQVL